MFCQKLIASWEFSRLVLKVNEKCGIFTGMEADVTRKQYRWFSVIVVAVILLVSLAIWTLGWWSLVLLIVGLILMFWGWGVLLVLALAFFLFCFLMSF